MASGLQGGLGMAQSFIYQEAQQCAPAGPVELIAQCFNAGQGWRIQPQRNGRERQRRRVGKGLQGGGQ